VLGTVFADAPRWLIELATGLLDDRDGDVRYEAFEALIRAGELGPALAWLEQAPEAEIRLSLMKWSARGKTRTCAELLAGASRRLRRMLVESVRVASWDDLAPAIDADLDLLGVLVRRDPDVIRARLAQLEVPPADVAKLLPSLAETTTDPETLQHIARLLVH
jgi:hypothetical protein